MEKKLDEWKNFKDVNDAYLRARDCSRDSSIDVDGVQVSSALDCRGRELPDETPLAPPVGYRSGPSLAEFVQRMIRAEVSMVAEQNEYESFEEADDFDIEDDPLDEMTPYEAVFMPKSGGVGGPPPTPNPAPQEPAAKPTTVVPVDESAKSG